MVKRSSGLLLDEWGFNPKMPGSKASALSTLSATLNFSVQDQVVWKSWVSIPVSNVWSPSSGLCPLRKEFTTYVSFIQFFHWKLQAKIHKEKWLISGFLWWRVIKRMHYFAPRGWEAGWAIRFPNIFQCVTLKSSKF